MTDMRERLEREAASHLPAEVPAYQALVSRHTRRVRRRRLMTGAGSVVALAVAIGAFAVLDGSNDRATLPSDVAVSGGGQSFVSADTTGGELCDGAGSCVSLTLRQAQVAVRSLNASHRLAGESPSCGPQGDASLRLANSVGTYDVVAVYLDCRLARSSTGESTRVSEQLAEDLSHLLTGSPELDRPALVPAYTFQGFVRDRGLGTAPWREPVLASESVTVTATDLGYGFPICGVDFVVAQPGTGRVVRTLHYEPYSGASFVADLSWDGRTASGERATAGRWELQAHVLEPVAEACPRSAEGEARREVYLLGDINVR